MAHVGNTIGLGQEVRYAYLSTANQTVFTGFDLNGFVLSYKPGLERVYVAGRRMRRGSDYTATDGATITITTALPAGIVVQVDALDGFSPANTYTQAQVDALVAAARLQVGTAQATTSGTFKDWSIPAGVKRITLMLQGFSCGAGASNPLLRVSSGGTFQTSGYLGAAGVVSASNTTDAANFTAGFGLRAASSNVFHGEMVLTNPSGNNWICRHVVALSNNTNPLYGAGSISLGGVLDGVRWTTGGGETMTAGSANVMWEF